MRYTAAKVAVLVCSAACCALLLSGCAAWRLAMLDRRLGVDPNATQPSVDAALQKRLDDLYARGAAALSANEVDAAIAAWRRYASDAPVNLAQARKVRGYLTLLDRESARRFAKQAAAGEQSRLPTNRSHVAVFPFSVQGPGQAGTPATGFNRAVVAMVTRDLVQVPSLTVLEREKIDYLLQEQKLAASGLVDPATAFATGKLLGAGTVVGGSVYNEAGTAGPGSGRYKINTAVADVAAGNVIGTPEALGAQAEFQKLEKQIVYGILRTMDIKDIPASVNKVHTLDWSAYARFAAGLKLLDEDRFDEARKAFHSALEFDPGFDLAEEAFLGTPDKGASFDELRARVGAGGGER